MSSSSLILNTNITVDNVQLDYTDISVNTIPQNNVIELKTKIPLYALCLRDVSGNTTSSLLNIRTTDPFSPDQHIDEVENNISEVLMNKNYTRGFAIKLLEGLSREVIRGTYPELQFLIPSTVSDFGETVLRILQHVLVRQLDPGKSLDEVNTYLKSVDASNSSFIVDILTTNENSVKNFITADKPLLDISYNETIVYGTNMTDAFGANIPSRILNSIYTSSKETNTQFDRLNLKKALTAFLFSDKNKITNIRQSNITPLGSDISLKCIPVQFKKDDEIYFTLNFTGYQIINSNGTPMKGLTLPDNSGHVPMSVTPIYLKCIVDDENIEEGSRTSITFSNLNYNWYNGLHDTDKTNLKVKFAEDIAHMVNIPIENIIVKNVKMG